MVVLPELCRQKNDRFWQSRFTSRHSDKRTFFWCDDRIVGYLVYNNVSYMWPKVQCSRLSRGLLFADIVDNRIILSKFVRYNDTTRDILVNPVNIIDTINDRNRRSPTERLNQSINHPWFRLRQAASSSACVRITWLHTEDQHWLARWMWLDDPAVTPTTQRSTSSLLISVFLQSSPCQTRDASSNLPDSNATTFSASSFSSLKWNWKCWWRTTTTKIEITVCSISEQRIQRRTMEIKMVSSWMANIINMVWSVSRLFVIHTSEWVSDNWMTFSIIIIINNNRMSA